MISARLLVEGELKRIQQFVKEHQKCLNNTVDILTGHPPSPLDKAVYISGFYQGFERLMHIMYSGCHIAMPATKQHFDALVKDAGRPHQAVGALIPPSLIQPLCSIAEVYFSSRHLRPSELDEKQLTVVAQFIAKVWHELYEYYKILLKSI
jgi:hypothetical protein